MPNMANGCACTMLRRSVYEVPLSTCSYLPRSGPKGSGGRNCMSSTRIRMKDTAKLTALTAPEVEDLGYAVVRVAMSGGPSDPALQVMDERADNRQPGPGDAHKYSSRLPSLPRGGTAKEPE